MTISQILTAFSAAMFVALATAHIRAITIEEARATVDRSTKIMATRVTHERLASAQFPNASTDPARYASLLPGTASLHLLYRGPMIPDSGELPPTGSLTPYLIEVEKYQDN